MTKCPSCGTSNEPDASSCDGCGEDLGPVRPRVKCLSCGTQNDLDAASCLRCREPIQRPLLLLSGDGQRLSLNINLRANQHWATKVFGEDGRLWDRHWQMEFVRRDASWYVVPNPRAVNDSLLNGGLLRGEAELKHGDIIAVGRASKNIIKTTLTVTPPHGP